MLANIVKEKNIFCQGKKRKKKEKPTLFSHRFECLQAEKKKTILIVFKE